MGVHVVARQAPRSTATVFSLSSASSPILQIISSTLDNTLRLDYQAEGKPHSFASFHFPGTNPFSSETWVQLAVSLEPDRLTFFVDCQEAAVLLIESENKINLELPQDVLITLGSTLGKRDSKFSGYLKTAKLSLKAYPRRPWICNNLTEVESLVPSYQIKVVWPFSSDINKVEENDRLKKLERRMGELARVLDMVQNEIDKLQKDDRLQKLEKRTEEVARVLDIVKDEPCCPQPCPPQPCCPQPCCPQPCCPQPCPPQRCTEAKVPDCQTPACNPCPPQPRPPQVCPTQNCKEENVPDCQRRACDGGNRECSACSEENVPEVCEQQPTSCVVNGYDFPNGAVIPGGDPCQECRCVDGNMACSPVRCPALSCHNPVRHTGECCPQCEQCKFQSKVYVNGETFTSKRHPCLQCHCSAGQVSCEHMAASCPTPQCTHPAKHRRQCCPTCSKCEYERRVYTDGTAFTSAGSGSCLQCRCKGGNVLCSEEKCPPVHCSNPVRDPHHCCPVCKSCIIDGVEYEEGSKWQPEGLCSSCTCVDGETLCTPTPCPPTNCHHPTTITGSCCSVCDSCTYNQHVYSNGQRFTLPDHPCYICTCQDGTVQCETQLCPPLNCRGSYTPPGECCPRCPGI
ncbi:kielin/chordin-like protein [Archocentrus centrarchus]|uniref:kielin/chordin-like protein n=1 Tax=Archocentrus centrarchus TaxID=63155 RepID=UPI0011EA3B6C|nr:kielin/chordin-like protein [Archocentrus centrarchus]